MSSTITCHIEVKIEGVWHHYSAPNIRSYYTVLARAGNTDNELEITPISLPRGLPEGISAVTRIHFEYDHESAYGASWFSGDELSKFVHYYQAVQKRENKLAFLDMDWGYLFGSSVGEFTHYPEDYPPQLEDVRLVFWFMP